MSNWRKVLRSLTTDTENQFDKLKLHFWERFKLNKPLMILPYMGYGTVNSLYLRGRVLENRNIGAAADNDSLWDNMLKVIQRANSNEIPGARVQATFQQQQVEAVTDEEGFFEIQIDLEQPPPATQLWHEVALELVESPITFDESVTAAGQVLVPPAQATFGVISDIDDTVLQSSAANVLKALRLLFLGNARTRLPFAGAAALYQALQHGPGGEITNPIFYVSSSPWNLYDFLVEFFVYHNIPVGPLFLLDYGLTTEHFLSASHHDHKLAQIDKVLTTYPDLPFVLIGDSGQKDAEIYALAVAKYPGQIRAVYIRDVTGAKRDAKVEAIAARVRTAGVPMELIADSLAAAAHAHTLGLLDKAELEAIQAAVAMDQAAASALEATLSDAN